MKFEVVVANPLFSLDKWGADDMTSDRHGRFHRNLPPKGKSDYAFSSHKIASMTEAGLRMVVVVPHGATD